MNYLFTFSGLRSRNLQAEDILESFIFPDSRAHFIRILARANILPELMSGLPPDYKTTASAVDFWSYLDVEGMKEVEERVQKTSDVDSAAEDEDETAQDSS